MPTTCSGKPLASPKSTPNINHVLNQNVDLSNVDQVSANAHLSEKESRLYIFRRQRIDSVPSNVQSSRQEALLYVFDDNEAVIKMIIKGRSPTMRHVSRTHRVTLDWLFDRINLDPKIQIKYVDTTNQLAVMLTKGSFTRDEWNNLLHLFNIMSNTTFSRIHFILSSGTQAVMSNRSQDSPTVKAKSRPGNLVSHQCLSMRLNSENEWSHSPGEYQD